MEKTERDTIENALARWQVYGAEIAATRDPLVRRAYEAGIPKLRIHQLTGLGRMIPPTGKHTFCGVAYQFDTD